MLTEKQSPHFLTKSTETPEFSLVDNLLDDINSEELQSKYSSATSITKQYLESFEKEIAEGTTWYFSK